MKKVLLFSFMFYVTSVMTNAQVVFDPETYEPDSLPDGMTIVDINGTKYLEAVLDGWGSYIVIDDFDVTSDYVDFIADAKYAYIY